MFGNAGAAAQKFKIQKSLRFRGGASAYLDRTFAAGDRKTWTLSLWFKRGRLGQGQGFLQRYVNGTTWAVCSIANADTILFYDYNGGTDYGFTTTATLRDPTAWYHLVFVFDTSNATASDRMRVYCNGDRLALGVDYGAPTLNFDGLINSAVSHEIGRYTDIAGFADGLMADYHFIDGQALTPASFGKIDTATGQWVAQPYRGSYGTTGFKLNFQDATSASTLANDVKNGPYSLNLRTTGTAFGGFTGLGGLAAIFDGNTNQGLAACGVAPTPAAGYSAASAVGRDWGVGNVKTITAYRFYTANDDGVPGSGSRIIDYKLQGSNDNTVWVDLTTAAATSGVPQVITVTSGINVSTAYRYHRLVFNAPGATNLYLCELQLYESGKFVMDPNNWSPNNISVTAGVNYDSFDDTPSNNFCSMNPLFKTATGITASNANLTAVKSSTSDQSRMMGTIGVSSGKWYWEVSPSAGPTGPGNYYLFVGICDGNDSAAYPPNRVTYNSSNDAGIAGGKSIAVNGPGTNSVYGANYTTNDIVGVAFDADSGTLTFYKNNVSQGVITGITSNTWFPFHHYDGSNTTCTLNFNFGQRPFSYAPPVGFKALHTGNLQTPLIKNPKNHFDIKLRVGNGSTQSYNDLQFTPGFLWNKERSTVSTHNLFNAVAGVTKVLTSNTTNIEATTDALTSFDANGITVKYPNTGDYYINRNSQTYVDWLWKAGGAPVANAVGTLTSQVSVNTVAGLSIVTYTGNGVNGATVGHGLGVVPAFIITKKQNGVGTDYGWSCYHKSLGTANIWLHLTQAQNIGNWTVAPTSSVFTPAVTDYNNVNTATYVNYCFAEVPGYSKFGSYVGNGSADGPYVHLGFRPKYLLVKRVDSTADWTIFDSARSPTNVVDDYLNPNASAAETVNNVLNVRCDFTANGFKVRDTWQGINASGGTIIFAAFAETPFKYANARY